MKNSKNNNYLILTFLFYRDAGKACASISVICPICRHLLSQCTDYIIVFSCGHGFHSECLGEPKSCYKCLNSKGWAPIVTNIIHSTKSFHVNNVLILFSLHISFHCFIKIYI